jgi:hypothetical protein
MSNRGKTINPEIRNGDIRAAGSDRLPPHPQHIRCAADGLDHNEVHKLPVDDCCGGTVRKGDDRGRPCPVSRIRRSLLHPRR